MTETAAAPAAAPSTSNNAKFPKAPKAMKPKAARTHPSVASLVETAIGDLNDQSGSSLIAIKKHIAVNNHKVDVKRLAPFIRRFLKSAVGKGVLIQVRGKGANGSFKLNKAVMEAKVTKKHKSDKPKKVVGAKKVKLKAAKSVKAPVVKKPEENGH